MESEQRPCPDGEIPFPTSKDDLLCYVETVRFIGLFIPIYILFLVLFGGLAARRINDYYRAAKASASSRRWSTRVPALSFMILHLIYGLAFEVVPLAESFPRLLIRQFYRISEVFVLATLLFSIMPALVKLTGGNHEKKNTLHWLLQGWLVTAMVVLFECDLWTYLFSNRRSPPSIQYEILFCAASMVTAIYVSAIMVSKSNRLPDGTYALALRSLIPRLAAAYIAWEVERVLGRIRVLVRPGSTSTWVEFILFFKLLFSFFTFVYMFRVAEMLELETGAPSPTSPIADGRHEKEKAALP